MEERYINTSSSSLNLFLSALSNSAPQSILQQLFSANTLATPVKMLFFALITALAIGASALPTEQSEIIVVAPVQNIPAKIEGLTILVLAADSKREVGLEKRGTAFIEVWFDPNGGGNYGQVTTTSKYSQYSRRLALFAKRLIAGVCYTFNSVWNDQITSLRISAGVQCTFAGGPDCGSSERSTLSTSALSGFYHSESNCRITLTILQDLLSKARTTFQI
jgi:hypothetical protein